MKTLNWAVVGFGHIGRRHCDMIEANDLTNLVAICDVKPRSELIFTSSNIDIPFFSSIEELLSSSIDIDLFSVCVPNGLHFEISSAILRKGKVAVIEKPIVLTNEEGEELRRISNNGQLIYGVLQNRYTPVVQWLKGLLTNDALGEIYRIDMDCLWNRDKRYYTADSWHGNKKLDGGTLFTQYSHFVDILLWLFGDIEVLSARFRNYNHKGLIDFEDSGDISFSTPKGADGHMFYSTSVYSKNMYISMNILAEKGSVRLSGDFLNNLEYCNIEGVERPLIDMQGQRNEYGAYSGSASNHHIVIDNIARDMLGMPAEVSTLEDGLKVVRLINEIYKFK